MVVELVVEEGASVPLAAGVPVIELRPLDSGEVGRLIRDRLGDDISDAFIGAAHVASRGCPASLMAPLCTGAVTTASYLPARQPRQACRWW